MRVRVRVRVKLAASAWSRAACSAAGVATLELSSAAWVGVS